MVKCVHVWRWYGEWWYCAKCGKKKYDRRSPFFREAHKAFLAVVERYRFVGDVDRGCDIKSVGGWFFQWLARYESRIAVRLRRGDDFVFVRMVNRFMGEYKKRLLKRLNALRGVKFQFMVTLTVNPKWFERLSVEFAYVGKQWQRLRAWLFKYCGHFEFLRILEITKKNRPHLHVLLKFDKLPSLKGDLLARFAKVWGSFVKISPVWNRFNAISYLLKYVNKSLVSNKRYDVSFSCLLFASNRRMFSVSQKLWKRLPVDVLFFLRFLFEDRFKYDGVVFQSELDVFCREKGLSLDRSLYRVEFDSKFPDLFGVMS